MSTPGQWIIGADDFRAQLALREVLRVQRHQKVGIAAFGAVGECRVILIWETFNVLRDVNESSLLANQSDDPCSGAYLQALEDFTIFRQNVLGGDSRNPEIPATRTEVSTTPLGGCFHCFGDNGGFRFPAPAAICADRSSHL